MALRHRATARQAGAPLSTPLGALRDLARDPLNWPTVAAPAAVAFELLGVGTIWVFAMSALAVIPLAGMMGRATENLAATLGPGVGGLLNATFGNAAELIIGLLIVSRGPSMYPLVKASITGSIIGNVLLVLGMAMLLGGVRYTRQEFNRTAVSIGSTLLALASIGLVMPTTYYYLFRVGTALRSPQMEKVESLSEEIALILAAVYVLYLVFSLLTHRHLYDGAPASPERAAGLPEWSRSASLIVLVGATAGVAIMGELLVETVQQAGQALGLNQVFLGVIVVATVGNAAEHSTAVMMALRNRMELAVQIAIGSSLQIALFVAPVLVFASLAMGNAQPLDLHFTLLELIAVILAVGIVALVSQDGETNWMEGVLLLAVYAILSLGFFFLPG
jgi:Ca2+:H+ antiporter